MRGPIIERADENNYGTVVRVLNVVRSELAALDEGTLGYRIRAQKAKSSASRPLSWRSGSERSRPLSRWGGYCAYGLHVGCNVTTALRARGFDARYICGGVSAWYAAGGARAMRPNGG